jgi:hypothetical protein
MKVSSPSGEVKYSYALSEKSCFYALEKSGTFGVRNSVLRGNGTEVFKTLKARMDEADKYTS